MISPNPIIGTGLHAVGGISAATCYLPSNFIKKWSWGTFWLAQAFFAWIVAPLVIGWATVPNFFHLVFNAPKSSMLIAFSLGAAYGFGGLSFGKAIIHIGYSLTYTLAIGISAVIGTLLPLAVLGGMNDYFSQPGSGIVILGMMMSVIGVALCGWAGFKKEKDIKSGLPGKAGFNMAAGLLLTIIAGILSGVFNLSLEFGQPVAELAAQNGAGHFEGNAKLIVSTSGCFLTNFIWFTTAGYRNNTLREFAPRKIQTSGKTYLGNWSLSALTGTVNCCCILFENKIQFCYF